MGSHDTTASNAARGNKNSNNDNIQRRGSCEQEWDHHEERTETEKVVVDRQRSPPDQHIVESPPKDLAKSGCRGRRVVDHAEHGILDGCYLWGGIVESSSSRKATDAQQQQETSL